MLRRLAASGAPKWKFPLWSRTAEPARLLAAAASDFCGGLLNRLTGSRWAAKAGIAAGSRPRIAVAAAAARQAHRSPCWPPVASAEGRTTHCCRGPANGGTPQRDPGAG
eukprot:SAG25_NODE_938_length_4670_cov_1.689783_1_plen_108_part_10